MRFAVFIYFILSVNICYAQQKIQFLKFEVFDDSTAYDCSKPIVLDFKPQHLGISFIDKTDSLSAKYAIKLRGSDNIEWIKIGNRGFMSYANLYGGEYEFLVKNLQNNAQNSLKFKIKPAFWQSWWFIPSIFLYIISVLGIIIYLFLMYRFRQRMRTQKIQNKISRDLHDDVGSTLSSIAILTQAAKNQLFASPQKTEKLLQQIGQNAQETLENMSDIVWTNKTLNDNFEQLCIRMQEYLGKNLEPKNIEYTFRFDDDLKTIQWNSAKYYDFYMVFKEAINNSMKYSESNLLNISILKEKNKLILKIIDNGKGFSLNNKMTGNGLINMKKRAENWKGSMAIHSAIGEGTIIELIMPL